MTRRYRPATWQHLFAAAAVLFAPPGYAADAPQRVVRVAFVHPQSPSTAVRGVGAFWERLRELGYVEGRNLVIETRWAEGKDERLPALVADVLGRKVDVIVTYGTPSALAAKKGTDTVPIVGVAMGEPLRTGLVTSLARPGGNLTGLSVAWVEGIAGKWLELLQETIPRLLPAPLVSAQRVRVTALAARYKLPAMYPLRDYVDVGGLMAYAPDLNVQSRRAADYVDKILKGARVADLPIEQPTQWALAVNLKAARALGLTIPQSILLRADEVIQ